MRKLALAALALALAAPAARAQTSTGKWGSLELGAGPYRPNIDHEFSGAHPWRDVFGGSPGAMFRLHLAKTVYDGMGAVEVGLRTGYFRKSGHAIATDTGLPTGDSTTFNILPTSLTLTYRADFLYEQARIPLVPYARVAVERYNWWVTKGDKWLRRGATNGWSATLGLALMLDFLDPEAGREMDQDYGITHTALYFDVTKSKVDDFGSKKSFDLSESRLFWSGGLLLVF